MKTADEMFQELGYVKDEKCDTVYRNNKRHKSFAFAVKEKRFLACSEGCKTNLEVWCSITDSEFDAINKKFEELGWGRYRI